MKGFNFLLFTLLVPVYLFAQQPFLGSSFYQNQYLANPAFAGMEEGFVINGAYKRQLTNIEGASSVQSFTAAYGFKNRKVGLGVIIGNDKAGLIQKVNAKGTYTYHLPINSDKIFFDFGLSLGIANESLDFTMLTGNSSDLTLINFNARKTYFDGDFGIALRTQQLTMQAAIPNLKRFFYDNQNYNLLDQYHYLIACSYRVKVSDIINAIEPKIAYNEMRNAKGILDLGAQIALAENRITVNGIYHTNNSITAGMTTTIRKQFLIALMYTANTATVQRYNNAELEIGLKYSLSGN